MKNPNDTVRQITAVLGGVTRYFFSCESLLQQINIGYELNSVMGLRTGLQEPEIKFMTYLWAVCDIAALGFPHRVCIEKHLVRSVSYSSHLCFLSFVAALGQGGVLYINPDPLLCNKHLLWFFDTTTYYTILGKENLTYCHYIIYCLTLSVFWFSVHNFLKTCARKKCYHNLMHFWVPLG